VAGGGRKEFRCRAGGWGPSPTQEVFGVWGGKGGVGGWGRTCLGGRAGIRRGKDGGSALLEGEGAGLKEKITPSPLFSLPKKKIWGKRANHPS